MSDSNLATATVREQIALKRQEILALLAETQTFLLDLEIWMDMYPDLTTQQKITLINELVDSVRTLQSKMIAALN